MGNMSKEDFYIIIICLSKLSKRP